MKRKITSGYVIQNFTDEGVFVSQEFVASCECEWEDEKGDSIESEGFYHSFEMKQGE